MITARDGRHELTYGYILNKVFDYYKVECGKGNVGNVKQSFS